MPNSHLILQSSLETRARQIVKALGGHWSRKSGMCCCPAHDDRTPSLSVGVAESAILFHCFAGCTSEEVLAGFKRCGIRPSDLFNGKGGQVAPIAKPFGPDVNALRLWQQAVPLAGAVRSAIEAIGGHADQIEARGRSAAPTSPALRTIRDSACKRFGTVLTPDYNAAHRDHLHLEPGGLKSFCR